MSDIDKPKIALKIEYILQVLKFKGHWHNLFGAFMFKKYEMKKSILDAIS